MSKNGIVWENGISENIKEFTTNKTVIGLINRLWFIKKKNNDEVYEIINRFSGKEEDAIILELEHLTDPYTARGSKKSRKRKSRKNKKSRKNQKSRK